MGRRAQHPAPPARAHARPATSRRCASTTASSASRASGSSARRSDILILHPGPMNRGVEIDSDVADGPHSVILNQVTNGVAVRMAVLYLLAGGRPRARRSGEGRRRPMTRARLAAARRPASIDPSQGLDEVGDLLVVGRQDRRRSAGIGAARRDGARSRSTARDWSCRPASSTCTATCASPGARTSRRSPPARAPRPRAASPPSARCRTPIPSPTTRRRSASSSARRSAPTRARVYPDRRDLRRPEGRDARRVRRDGRRRRGGGQRRRQAGGERAAHAHRARVRAHLRHPGRRPLRGADARRTAAR